MTILIDNLSKSFQHDGKALTVLRDINLEIKDGEFVSLLGPSGCGKSTLLNIIAGLEQASAGEVLVDGIRVKAPGADRVVVFQEAALFPWLSVLDNVMFGLNIAKTDKIQARDLAMEYLKMVHLTRFSKAYPHELSGGMRQRVAIARALVMDPKYLLMDEPFGALDEQTKMLLHRDLQEIWQQTGKTIIFVTHNIREAVLLADRIMVMGTRPGLIKKEFRVEFSRPRWEGNHNLALLEGLVLDELREEIAKVMREEVDNDYSFTQDNISWSADRDLGGNI